MNFKLFIYFIIFQKISSLLILLQKAQERCIIDEFIANHYFVVKYKIFTENKENITDILPFLSFKIKDAVSNDILFYHNLESYKGKFTHSVKKTGLYKLCMYASFETPNKIVSKQIFANLKVSSDNMDKLDLINAIKTNDIERMENKAENIIGLLGQANQIKKSQINTEKDYSLEVISNAKRYKYLNIIQIVITAIIGLIQLNNFRRFLKSKHVV